MIGACSIPNCKASRHLDAAVYIGLEIRVFSWFDRVEGCIGGHFVVDTVSDFRSFQVQMRILAILSGCEAV